MAEDQLKCSQRWSIHLWIWQEPSYSDGVSETQSFVQRNHVSRPWEPPKTGAKGVKATGIKPLSGHSLRIGSTLKYLLCNIPFDVIKVKGRWASDAFLLYLHRHAQILAPYMQATPELHESFLRYTMPPVRG